MNCDVCGESVNHGVAVIKHSQVTTEALCKQCSYKVFPQASAEVVLFVKHMEDYHGGIIARDSSARGLWNACKVYFQKKGLL
jgi:DNA-directed RNA polymerase subunit RPC12/RpoP